MKHVVETNDLHLTYPDGTKALNGVNVAFDEAEIVGLIGQNGAGKSTLSKCLNATLTPTEGTVSVEGIDTREKRSSNKIVEKVGYVFQNPDHQLFNRSVWDEITYGPRNLGMHDEEVNARAQEAAAVAGVRDELFEEHPNSLTKGLRQRVAIASILAMKPSMIIVDEPTTGQDAKQSIEIMNFLRRLKEEDNRTIVIVTHIIPIVQQYCDRVICLKHGRELIEGTPREVFDQPDTLAESAVQASQITRFSYELDKVVPNIRRPYLTVDEAVWDVQSISGGE